MKIDDVPFESINKEQLAQWGLLRQLYKEFIIDKEIKNESQPRDIEQKQLNEDWLKYQKINLEKELKIWQFQNGFAHVDWEKYIARRWRWSNWCKNKFKDKIPSYFLKKKTALDKYTFILIRVEDEDLSNELFLRISENEAEIQEIASTFSKGDEKFSKGVIGPISLNQINPSIGTILERSKEGQLWPPQKIDSWWIILKLQRKYFASLDDEMYLKLSLELGDIYLNKIIDNPKN